MSYRPTFLGCAFVIAGVGAAIIEVLGVLEYVGGHGMSVYLFASSCFLAGVAPVLPALADWFWRNRQRRYAALAWVAFLVCLAFVVTSAIQRTGSTTDGGEQARASAKRAAQIAEAAEKQATEDYTAAQSAALKECVVRGKRCMDAEEKASTARAALARARATLVAAPVAAQKDAMASRLAAVTPLSEEQIRLLWPMLAPAGISLLSTLLFAGWFRIDFVGAPQQAPEAPSAPVTEPAATTLPAPARTPLPAKFGSVEAFLVSRTEPVAGEEIECERDLYGDYKDWCEASDVSPYRPSQFAAELARVGKVTGLRIEVRGREAFVLDRRLAA